MLKIPRGKESLEEWTKEVIDECMGSAHDRGMIYTKSAQYYYIGSYDRRAAIYNKTKNFVDKLSGFLMQPTDVRFNVVFDSSQPEDVLERAQLVSEKLTQDFRNTDTDVLFAETVKWSLINGCHLLKIYPDGESFHAAPCHPQNFGVLSETINSLDEQDCFCHVSYPTLARLRTMLDEHPRRDEFMARIEESWPTERDQEEPTYFHAMVVGGLQPLGDVGGQPSQAGGLVNVFPVPAPWRAQQKISQTVKFCELWVKDRDRKGDWTTLQIVYGAEPIIIEGEDTRRNLSRIPGHHPFVKIQSGPTPGYFFGRSRIADIQMLQDLLNKRLRDIKVMWDRNVRAPYTLSGFTGITPEIWSKMVEEGGFIADPNPNAKANKLLEPPPETYLQELEFIWKMFDEASGFSPIMSGQGEPGVRAGVHAQTLVRTSSPQMIDEAARIERQLATVGFKGLRIMQAMDPTIYITDDNAIEFTLGQLPGDMMVQVDSHSGSPAFAEDNRQVAIALARSGAIDAEDLIHMLHPPGADLLLARLKQRKKEQAKQAQEEKQEELIKGVLHIGTGGQHGRGGRKQG